MSNPSIGIRMSRVMIAGRSRRAISIVPPARGLEHSVALGRQLVFQELPDIRLVVDDEHLLAGCLVAAPRPSAAARRPGARLVLGRDRRMKENVLPTFNVLSTQMSP